MKRTFKPILALVLCFVFVFGTAAEAATVRIPSSTKKIEAEAFYGDTSLDEVSLPNGVTTIGTRAFAYSSLQIINLPNTVKSLGTDVFKGCNLKAIVCQKNSDVWNLCVQKGYEDILTSFYVTASVPANNGNSLQARWSSVYGATKYEVYCSTAEKEWTIGSPIVKTVQNSTECVFTGLESWTTYYIWVKAYKNNTILSESDEFSTYTKGNSPNPQPDDPVFIGDGPIIRDVYSTDGGKTLTVEFDEYEGAAWYDVIFRNTGTDETETTVANAAENTKDGLVSVDSWIEVMLQDNTEYAITVKAYDSDLQLISFESDDPVYYTTDFNGATGEGEEDAGEASVYPTGIELNKRSVELDEDDYITLTATLSPNNVDSDCSGIDWTTSDSSVAKVSSAGKITAQGPGTAIITATTVNGLSDYCTVTVRESSLLTGSFDQNSISLPVRAKVPLGFSVKAESGSIAKVLLKNKKTNKTIQTISFNGERKVTGQFELDSNKGKAFAARGDYTLSLVAVASDGSSFTLQTITATVTLGGLEIVTGVEASYSSSGIDVSWNNDENADEYRILFITEENYSHNQGSGAQVVKANGDASNCLIPSSKLTIGTTYLVRVTAVQDGLVGPAGSFVYVMATNSSTPCVSARFVGDQSIYSPGESIYIDISYAYVNKVHYINGDNSYNSSAYEEGVLQSGDIGGSDGYSSNRSGDQQVRLVAQQTPGKYHVQIWAKNVSGTHATGSYNNSNGYLELFYWVSDDSLDAPRQYTPVTNDEDASIEVSWRTVSGASGYRIMYATEDDARLALTATSNTRSRGVVTSTEPVPRGSSTASKTLTGMGRNTPYYIWVQAFNSYGYGELSSSKTAEISETYPTVSASFVNGKTSYNPGETIKININYTNIIKVHYSNGDHSYNPYSYEGSSNAGDIWADETLKENAKTNISGNKTVTLPAQSTPGSYHVQIWAKDFKANQATSSYNYETETTKCLHLTYTVAGTVPVEEPTVSLSINSNSQNSILAVCNKDNVIWLTATYSKADSLLFRLYQNNIRKTFTTVGCFDTDKSLEQFPKEGPLTVEYSDSPKNEAMTFIPSEELEPGTYTLRVTAKNNKSGIERNAEVEITLTEVLKAPAMANILGGVENSKINLIHGYTKAHATSSTIWSGASIWSCHDTVVHDPPKGTPVYAPLDGTITYYQYMTDLYKDENHTFDLISYGNNAIFTSSDGKYKILFAHMDTLNTDKTIIKNSSYSIHMGYNDCKSRATANNKTKGSYAYSAATNEENANKYNTWYVPIETKTITKGTQIGTLGCTGNAGKSSGNTNTEDWPHLHIEVYYKDGTTWKPCYICDFFNKGIVTFIKSGAAKSDDPPLVKKK